MARIDRRERQSPRRLRRCALLLAATLLAGPAGALTIDDIDPLYFGPGQAQGFDPVEIAAIGRSPNLQASPFDSFLGVGGASSSSSVRVTSQVIGEIHQLPANATPADPAIVDSTWTIQNISAGALSQPVLLFTVLDPADTYPGDPLIGLDAGLLDLLEFVPSSGPSIVYGAVQLPDLGQGESAEIVVRYVVGGPLQLNDASQVLAPLGLAMAVTYATVPEPSTLLLCGLALAGIAVGGRKRPNPRSGRPLDEAERAAWPSSRAP